MQKEMWQLLACFFAQRYERQSGQLPELLQVCFLAQVLARFSASKNRKSHTLPTLVEEWLEATVPLPAELTPLGLLKDLSITSSEVALVGLVAGAFVGVIKYISEQQDKEVVVIANQESRRQSLADAVEAISALVSPEKISIPLTSRKDLQSLEPPYGYILLVYKTAFIAIHRYN